MIEPSRLHRNRGNSWASVPEDALIHLACLARFPHGVPHMDSFYLTAAAALIPSFPVGVSFHFTLDHLRWHILRRHVFEEADPDERACLEEILTQALGQPVYEALRRYADPDA